MSLSKKISNIAITISDSPSIKSIRYGLMYTMPLILAGSISTIVLQFPIISFQNFMTEIFTESWKEIFISINYGTFRIISILILLGISYSIINNDTTMKKTNINPIIPTLAVFSCYIVAITNNDNIISLELAGTNGFSYALIISVIVSNLFIWLYKHRIIKVQIGTEDGDMILSQTIRVLEPTIMIFFIISIVKVFVEKLQLEIFFSTLYKDIVYSFVYNTDKISFAYFSSLLSQILWFFGIHGNNLFDSLNHDVLSKAMENNILSVANGNLPKEIFTQEFFNIFVYLGGSGSTMCMIIAIIIKKKRNLSLKLAKVSILPALFNINEIIVYGFPIVLNPFFIIPFVITPLVLITVSFWAMTLNLVPITQVSTFWTAPIFVGGYVSTGYSFSGVLLQLLNLCIGTFIYMPFVEMYDVHIFERNKKVLSKLFSKINDLESKKSNSILERKDEIGFFARSLSKDIYNAIVLNKNSFYLEYQPQLDNYGEVIGCEALLRWKHEKYGMIPPPVIITIADECGLTDNIGDWVITTAFEERSKWTDESLNQVVMSVNLSPLQLKNPMLLKTIKKTISSTGLDPKFMEFELTESIAVDQSIETRQKLLDLKALGVRLAIDDFGMGHSSLLYIRDFTVDTVKLDGSLVRDIATDIKSQEIVTTITNLCKMLNLNIVAEVVETQEQRNKLENLGCDIYQGYLYSASLSSENFLEFAKKLSEKNNIL